MSERGGSGGTPGNPPRIPGIPSNAHFHELAEWRTLNQQRPRPSIADQEMWWCENLMPIGAYYLRALPDHGTAIFTVPAGPPGATKGVQLTGITPVLGQDGTTNGRIVVQKNPPIPPYGLPQIVQNVGTCGPLTTTHRNDFLILFTSAQVPIANGTPMVDSVASTSNLDWQLRFRVSRTIDSTQYPTAVECDVEVWFAPAPRILSGEVITITYNEDVQSAIFGCVAVTGVNLNVGWDAGSTTMTNYNGTSSPGPSTPLNVTGLNTTGSNDFIVSFFVGYTNNVLSYTQPTFGPWGNITGGPQGESSVPGWCDAQILAVGSNLLGAWNQDVAFETIVSAPQTNFTAPAFGDSGLSGYSFIAVADAVAGYSPNTSTILSIASLGGLPATADTILIAGWIGNAAGVVTILNDTGGHGITLSVNLGSNSVWSFTARDASGATIVTGTTTVTGDITVGWHSYALSVRFSTQTAQLLVDSVLEATSFTWSTNHPVGLPGEAWQVGPVASIGDFSSLWFAAAIAFFDLSIAGNVHTLFGTTNCFVDWGTQGQLIDGTSPPLFLYGDSSTYPTNLGTGGSFTAGGHALINETGPVACT